MNDNIFLALLLTLFAGLATGIGSLIGFLARKTNTKFLCFSLGLSAGVMIYISFMELLHEARLDLAAHFASTTKADGAVALLFFGGIVLAALIDRLLPESDNPHELHSVEEMAGADTQHHNHSAQQKLRRAGIFSALALAVHNFPEGIATFITAYTDVGAGIAIAVAVAIHNIPEGIAVSVPIYYATGSRKRAFWYSFFSGFAEPAGAVIAWLILLPFITPVLVSSIMAAVAGIMIYIALDELLPATHYYGWYHIALYGLFIGMAIMATSLIIL